jgi:hypothetical protein
MTIGIPTGPTSPEQENKGFAQALNNFGEQFENGFVDPEKLKKEQDARAAHHRAFKEGQQGSIEFPEDPRT